MTDNGNPNSGRLHFDTRLLIAVVCVVVLACVFGFTAARFLPEWIPSCERSGIPLRNPNWDYEAVIIEDHCSALDQRRTGVIIREQTFFNWPPFLRDQRMVYVTDLPAESLSIDWNGTRTLAIEYDPSQSFETFDLVNSWGEFSIVVEPEP